MKKFTKFLAGLLIISSTCTHAHLVDSWNKWLKNSDFGSYIAPLALVGSFFGLGYLAYKDHQNGKKNR